LIANAIQKNSVTSRASKPITATQGVLTAPNDRAAREHHGPAAKEEKWLETRGPAEEFTDSDENWTESESGDGCSSKRPLSRRTATADIRSSQSGKILATQAQTVVVNDRRGRAWFNGSRKLSHYSEHCVTSDARFSCKGIE